MSRDSNLPPSSNRVNTLPVDSTHITEELKARAKSELLEDENTRVLCLELLRSMLAEEKDLYWQNEDTFLLAFLRARKFDVNRAFILIKNFYNNMGKHADIFLNFDRIKCVLEENAFCILPSRAPDGSVILVPRCSLWDPDRCSSVEIVACYCLAMLHELRSPATQIAGFQIIANMKDFSLKQAIHSSPRMLKFFNDMMQNTLPVRIRCFHIVNQNQFFTYMWQFVKIFISKKLQDRVILHGNDMSSLHKYFHPSILPDHIGGELPECHQVRWLEEMKSSLIYIKHLLSFGYQKYTKRKL